MTSEEAIDLLDNLNGMIEDNHNSNYDTAFKMAVKALEQEPCEDAISRQAVIKHLHNEYHGMISDESMKIYEIINMLKEQPPVTPKPKTGHWNRITDRTGHLVWECDKCGWVQRFNTNYCPDCGKKMQEGE